MSRLLLWISGLLVLCAFASPAEAAVSCTLSSTSPSVTVCNPKNGATVTSPVTIEAGTTDREYPVIAMAIYVDNNLAWKQNVSEVNTTITMSAGSHYVVVQAWDSGGRVFKTPINITVSTSSSTCVASGDPAVRICSPTAGSTVPSPVNVVAGSNNSAGVVAMAVYVDNQLAYKDYVTSVNTNIALPNGPHYLVVQSWDSLGRVTKASLNFSVGTSSGGCSAGTAPSIHICSPTQGTSVTSPVRVQATPASTNPVVAMAIYVDNTLAWKQNVSSIDTTLNIAAGQHYMVVQYWDSTGAVVKSSVSFSVQGSLPTVTFSANPTTISYPQSSTLSWTTSGATQVSIDNGIGAVPLSGSVTVAPTTTTTYTLTATGNGGTQTSSVTVTVSGSPGDLVKINHIVFMLQENRSFDNYFGMLNPYRAMVGLPQDVDGFTLDANGLPTNTNPNYANTGTVRAFKMTSVCTENVSPSWNETHVQANRFNPGSTTSLNDGYVFTAAKLAIDRGYYDTQGLRAMGYYDWTHLPYYYYMASQFGTSDRFFSAAPTATNPNRHYLYAGTSEGHAYPWSGPISDHKTIFDLLSEAGITWRIYSASFQESVFNQFSSLVNKYPNNIVPIDQYFTDVQNGTLPQVVTLETSDLNEHPANNIQTGSAYVKRVVDALMQSQYWNDSAFFLTYDEAGGLYDHIGLQPTVSPDGIKPIDLASTDIQGDFTVTGFRVPLIVVSPYAKAHYVSHTAADFTAILKFIEKRYNLPNLTARDAAQIDMTEFFDFVNKPWATPPAPPAQPTDGPCYYDHLP
ncbi:MAG TPA: alkaline phosphatase family protein [Terriglobales bacterium]|nr:alkaline phosphatase family protein [Terriglobales bacterium]